MQIASVHVASMSRKRPRPWDLGSTGSQAPQMGVTPGSQALELPLDHFIRTINRLTGLTAEEPGMPKRRRCQHCSNIWFCSEPCPNAPHVPPFLGPVVPRPVHPGTATIRPCEPYPVRAPRPPERAAAPAAPVAAPVRSNPSGSAGSSGSLGHFSTYQRQQTPRQSQWQEVLDLCLPVKTTRLDRTKEALQDILNDAHMSLHLASTRHQIPHGQSIIANIPNELRFKIGITRDACWRYYGAPYCYNKFYSRRKDGVDFQHMLIIHISHSRETAATLEHSHIVNYKRCEPRRCANRKCDIDDHILNESDSGDERSDGPFFVYVVVGKSM